MSVLAVAVAVIHFLYHHHHCCCCCFYHCYYYHSQTAEGAACAASASDASARLEEARAPSLGADSLTLQLRSKSFCDVAPAGESRALSIVLVGLKRWCSLHSPSLLGEDHESLLGDNRDMATLASSVRREKCATKTREFGDWEFAGCEIPPPAPTPILHVILSV